MLHRLWNAIVPLVAAVGIGLAATSMPPALAQPAGAAADEYTERIAPILERRCVACHSCNNAPCQLNVQSYSGVARGAARSNVYDRFRPHSVAPTRLDIDATTIADWRTKGFKDVTGVGDPRQALLMKLIRFRGEHPGAQPKRPVNESKVCMADTAAADTALTAMPELGMPCGLPPLLQSEVEALSAWLQHGAPGPVRPVSLRADSILPQHVAEVRAWEGMLNGEDARRRLVARYLYEHMFLAHLYVPDASGASPAFYRLVRSRTACEAGPEEIATRRPTDDPGPGFRYCIKRIDGAMVDKTHIPYPLTAEKRARIERLLLGSDWKATRTTTYSAAEASNPFVTFADIPVRARYQYLLDDARYQIATFIKGPVCNGSTAVNSIQEQFFVMFLSPDADGMVASREHAARARELLILPGAAGSDVPVLSRGVRKLADLVRHREAYRRLRAKEVAQRRPEGYSLVDIWNGDGHNPNAMLTVLRHFDNAEVLYGAVGDLSKTAFVLDYPLLERLVYNLVVNFDVFGNVGHQSLTRLYMDMIRMEAEELFLSFLPPGARTDLREQWYRGGVLTKAKMHFMFPLVDEARPTAIKFTRPGAAKAEFVSRVIAERMPPVLRDATDRINWRQLPVPPTPAGSPGLDAVATSLASMASVKASSRPFARYFPDLVMLLLRGRDGKARLYSIVHNREHANVSWIQGESLRLAPEEDTLTIRAGVLGAYPNMLFVADEAGVRELAAAAVRIRSNADYERLVDRWGIRRTSDRFWAVYDEVTALQRAADPVGFGYLDLSRYALERK